MRHAAPRGKECAVAYIPLLTHVATASPVLPMMFAKHSSCDRHPKDSFADLRLHRHSSDMCQGPALVSRLRRWN